MSAGPQPPPADDELAELRERAEVAAERDAVMHEAGADPESGSELVGVLIARSQRSRRWTSYAPRGGNASGSTGTIGVRLPPSRPRLFGRSSEVRFRFMHHCANLASTRVVTVGTA